jgi:small nuclear ribonucleoprotein (snRNP)-like protein
MSDRPIDVLNQAKGKRVLLRLKNKIEISGTLQALDLHLNMWLDDAEMKTEDEKTKLGTVLVRGDTILLASPVNE